MKFFQFTFMLAALFAVSVVADGQALPTASRAPLQVGVGWSVVSTDYTFDYIKGVTVFADFNFTRRLSLEGEAHQTSMSTPDGIGEDSYLAGPRYSLVLQDRANVYVKALGGIGRFTYEPGAYLNPHSNIYGIAAVGGGVEFRATSHINVRAIDVEYQVWPGFPSGSLMPFVTTFGVAFVH